MIGWVRRKDKMLWNVALMVISIQAVGGAPSETDGVVGLVGRKSKNVGSPPIRHDQIF